MRKSSLFWGICLLALGFLFLLENFGILKVNVWNLIWPLFLILLGIWIIVGRYFKDNIQEELVNIPLDGASKASFHIKHGAGKLNISSGADPGFGLQGSFAGGLNYESRHHGDTLDVTMKAREFDFPIFFNPDHTLDWICKLTNEIPLSLNFDMGANDAQIDLHEANVTDISLNTGASATEITLPSQSGFTKVDVHSGAASIKIHIPSNVAAKIRVTGGLSSANIDQVRFPKDIDSYRSSDYDTAINKIDLHIEMGVGSVTID